MGPEYASHYFLAVAPDADNYKVILYGSLALTGKGHLTDVSIKEVFAERDVEIVFNIEEKDLPHENTMDFIAYKNGDIVARRRVMSIGPPKPSGLLRRTRLPGRFPLQSSGSDRSRPPKSWPG